MSKQGFECEFVKKLQEVLETKCLICKRVLREPYQADCCGKSYCHQCIAGYKSTNQPCLECGSKAFTLFHNKGLQKSIYGLCVYCTYKNLGCEWTGELKELDDHLNVHQLLDQDGGEQHHTQKIHITDRTPDDVAKRVIEGERAKFGWGLFQFIKHGELEPKYLKNDRLYFQIGQIELK